MAHEETIRLIPGAKVAVLMMHGIAGTPDHFRKLLPLEHLIPETWSVYNVLIEGHGKQVEDFSRSSMAAWKRHTMGVFHNLCETHDQVIIIGHSMGTLFAMDMARERPEKVAFLFLIGVPLRVGVKFFGVRNLIRFPFGKLDPNDPIQVAVSKASSITPTWKVWKYIGWLPRIVELIGQMHRSAKLLPDLNVPAIAYQSQRDEMVSRRTWKLLEASGRVEVYNLLRSTHFYYHPQDVKLMQQAFQSACETYVP